jgi:fatty-acyl-CoA synthase
MPFPESYSQGPAAPLLEVSISHALSTIAQRFPDRDALVVCHQNVRLSWAELDREATRVARGLAGLGLLPGDRAGIWATNCVEWVLLQYGAARAGLVLVNVNPAYRSYELSFVLRRSRIKALFLRAADARTNYRAILEECGAPVCTVWLGEASWEQMLANGCDLPPHQAQPNDVANIQYTSGTTGSPKGVLLTHRNLVNNGLMLARGFRATEQDRICVPVPMYHCFGCVIGTMVSLTTGAAMILPAATFDPRATLAAIQAERATALYGVPTMFIAELEHPDFDQFDCSSLRTGIMAGAPCPAAVMTRVMENMHCAGITIAYGQTESSPAITMSGVDDPMELRVSTIGKALPNTEVKIVGPGGATLPVGEPGELLTRGYLVMKGYDEEPEATAATIDSEGWLRTGDLAAMRDDGYLVFTGRSKDLIIRGGENIYPREVEDFLRLHPKIADVSVVGLPDARLGETVLAWIKLRAGETANEEEIRAFCKDRIVYFKIPQHVRFVEAFPMTVTGKVRKIDIRRQEMKERGMAE